MLGAFRSVMLSLNPSALSREQELELLAGLIEGDEHAWRRFQGQYVRLIFRCIRKATHRFSSLLGEDDEREIYANLLLQLLVNDKRKLRLFEASRGNRLSTWLGLLATHTAYDHLRSRRRELGHSPWSDDETHDSEQVSPLDEFERKQHNRIVADMLTGLSEKDRQFVALYFNRGMSPEAVATVMNISVKTVYSKKHKIRSRLEEMATAHRLAA
jgi:RNA polymerase sigma-70 factor (ECF subfamily)